MKSLLLRLTQSISSPFLLMAFILTTSGCSVALQSQSPSPPAQMRSEQVALSQRAEGIEGKVGWGRFTAFYIPLVPIYIDGGDGNEQVMQQVGNALQRAGYKVKVVAGSEPSLSTPLLKCKVDKFWFNNYTWFFPIIPTWGEVRLTVNLVSSDGGKILWSRSFSGNGSTLNFTNGYSIAANKSMKKILDEMVTAFASDEFHRILSHG